MSEGTQVAQSAADVVLLCSALGAILELIDISHAAHRRIVLSFSWSFLYSLFAIPLAAGTFVWARILAEYAELGEMVGVLCVVGIALRSGESTFGGQSLIRLWLKIRAVSGKSGLVEWHDWSLEVVG